jgi:hypothetical protein
VCVCCSVCVGGMVDWEFSGLILTCSPFGGVSCWPSDCRVSWSLLCSGPSEAFSSTGACRTNMLGVRCAGSDAGECWVGPSSAEVQVFFCFVLFLMQNLKKRFSIELIFNASSIFSSDFSFYTLWESILCTPFSEGRLRDDWVIELKLIWGSCWPVTWAKLQNLSGSN